MPDRHYLDDLADRVEDSAPDLADALRWDAIPIEPWDYWTDRPPLPPPGHSVAGKKVHGRQTRWLFDDLPMADDPLRTAWVETVLGRDRAWIVAVRFSPQGPGQVVSEVRVFPNELARAALGRWSGSPGSAPPGGLTSRALRELQLGSAIIQRQASFEDETDIFAALVAADPSNGPAESRLREAWVKGDSWAPVHLAQLRRPRKARKDPNARVAIAAHLYSVALEAGLPRPHVAVAAFLEQSPGTVRNAIAKARREGILEPAPGVGRKGGVLTPKGQALIDGLLASRSTLGSGNERMRLLASVARTYVNAIGSGEPAVRAIARRFGLSERQARARVRAARSEGLLTDPPTPKSEGGRLTPFGMQLLEEQLPGSYSRVTFTGQDGTEHERIVRESSATTNATKGRQQ